MKRVVVAGTVNRDLLVYPDGRRRESLGGLVYSLATLALLYGRELEILPVCWVGEELHNSLPEFLEQLPGVSTTGLSFCREPANQVTLEIHNDLRKVETLRGGVPPLTTEMLAPWLPADGLLLNFTSGSDMSQTTTGWALTNCGGLSLVDLHSLTLDAPAVGRRSLRLLPAWREWVRGADILQLAEAETWSLTGEPEPERAQLLDLIRDTIAATVDRMVVTRGERGLLAGERDREPFELPAVPREGSGDTTGCGDVTGAALLGALLLGRSFREALQIAVRAAAVKAAGQGIGSVLKLERQREVILA